MKKRALITGIGGQDGYFLAKLLLDNDYDVYGISRIPVKNLLPNDFEVYSKVHFCEGDLLDQKSLEESLRTIQPDEIYHLAAQSNVGKSFSIAQETYRVNTVGSLQLFECANHVVPAARIYFSGSSEMFGNAPSFPQNESTPFRPKSPYGMSKVAAYYSAKFHRESCGQFISTGITYNHESERRPLEFVTQKICHGLAAIAAGKEKVLSLGNLETIRDWGFAGDYVVAMWKLMQHSKPVDAVIASGVGHSVQNFVDIAASVVGLDLEWEDIGKNRKAINKISGQVVVDVHEEYYRESEEVPLIGDPSFIMHEIQWKSTMTFESLVERMTNAAIKILGL